MAKLGKVLAWIGSGGGVAVPAIGFFQNHGPPLFSPATLFTGALAGIMITVISIVGSKNPEKLPPLGWSVGFAGIGFVLIVCYFLFRDSWTVANPNDESDRWQVGFGRADFSLTEKGKEYKANFPEDSLQNWMLKATLFRPEGPRVLWTSSSIAAAGVTLVVLYFLSFSLWSIGCTVLAFHAKAAGVAPPDS